MLESKERVATNLKLTALNRHLDSIVRTEGGYDKDGIIKLFGKYEIKSIKPENIIEIFQSSLNIKYSDPRSAVKVESFSLFE
jgi:cell division protein FtsI/penicillin-binding protein 2